jgi:hypothetical protein
MSALVSQTGSFWVPFRGLARRYATAGPVGLISQRFNRPSNNRLDDGVADRVIKILRSTYADFGPTLATEKLRTKHGIELAKETVRRLQIAVGPVCNLSAQHRVAIGLRWPRSSDLAKSATRVFAPLLEAQLITHPTCGDEATHRVRHLGSDTARARA